MLKYKQAMDQKENKSFFSEAKSLILVVIIALLIRTFFAELFFVPTGSMKETILEGDYIFSTKYDYGFSRYSLPFSPALFKGRFFANEPTPGDVVIMRPPHNMNERYIKRLIGVPGDKIQVIDDLIYINDQPIKRIYRGIINDRDGHKFYKFKETLPNGISYYSYKSEINSNNLTALHSNFGPYYVEKGKYFFVGDNRDHSGDSRYQLGTVPFENLIAKGRFVIFSASTHLWDPASGFVEQIKRIGKWVTSIQISRFFQSLYE